MARGRTSRLLDYDLLLATSLLWFLAQFLRFLFPPLFGPIGTRYGVSNTTLGLLFSTLMFVYAGMQFPSGALADRYGMARVIAAGGLVASSGAFIAYGIRSFPALVAGAILIGLGTGAHKTVAINLLSRVYSGRTGETIGTMDAVGLVGGASGPTVVVLVLSMDIGWPAVFLIGGGIGIACTALFRNRIARRSALVARENRANERDGSDEGPVEARDYVEPFLDPRLSAFVVVTVAYGFVWQGLSAFLPLYLERAAGLSTEAAGLAFGSLFLVGLVQPLTGSLGDRVGPLFVMVVALGVATTSLSVLVASPSPAVAWLAVPFVGLGLHGFRPVRETYLVDVIPTEVGGGTLGIARTVMLGVGAAAAAAIGYLADAVGFTVAFGVLAGVLGVGAVLVTTLFAVDRRKRRSTA